jgi:hypothetical protein
MKRFKALMEGIKKISWAKMPKIGWWLENDKITFYHGTHFRNLEFIEKNGILAPTSGPTAGWVSLALTNTTAFGYAAMSGAGGESGFRAAGSKVTSTPPKDRIVFVLKIPKSYVLKNMAPERGAMQSTKNRLKDRNEYEKWSKTDMEYYDLTEIRFPKKVPKKFIVGYMQKS